MKKLALLGVMALAACGKAEYAPPEKKAEPSPPVEEHQCAITESFSPTIYYASGCDGDYRQFGRLLADLEARESRKIASYGVAPGNEGYFIFMRSAETPKKQPR